MSPSIFLLEQRVSKIALLKIYAKNFDKRRARFDAL